MSSKPPQSDEPAPLTLAVRVSAKLAHQIRAAAAREGQPPEAQAALWLEEHAAEVARTTPGQA